MTEQKVAIITGAGSGIGAATAKRFAKEGYKVVLNGRTKDKLDRVAADIGKAGSTLVVAGDVASESDVAALIKATVEAFGRIDVLVNNAGMVVIGGIGQVSFEEWNRQMAVNAGGIFLTVKAAAPYLEKTKGSIINVSSVSGLGGDWGLFSYNATKGAVSNITKALAQELGAKGIRVNAVAPSLTRTDMTAGLMQDPGLVQKFIERIPLARIAEPEDVGDAIFLLASNDARFITGVVLPVDGGVNASNGQPKLM